LLEREEVAIKKANAQRWTLVLQDVLMSISLPCAPVAIMGTGFGSEAAGFTNENPDFPFHHLDAVQCGVLNLAMGTDFCLHPLLTNQRMV
jgi:Na+/proline symporter